jgi:hypothetical protein
MVRQLLHEAEQTQSPMPLTEACLLALRQQVKALFPLVVLFIKVVFGISLTE